MTDPLARAHDHLILGLDVGGTKCAAIVGDRHGRVCERLQWPSEVQRGPTAMIDELCRRGRELVERFGGIEQFAGIGVPVGGPLDAQNGIVDSPPNLPGWDAIPLQQLIQAHFGLATRIEHDAAACALAEWMWGAGQERSRVAYLTCGSGFGCGLVIDGKPYHGARGRSPEIGHVRYRTEGPVAFNKVGSFEAFAAGNSLPGLAAWCFPGRWAEQPPTGSQLSALAAEGDREAVEVVRQNALAVGSACALVGDLLVPDVITLGSLARYFGQPWLDVVIEQFRSQVLPDVAQHCEVCPAALGDRLQDCSALAVGCAAAGEMLIE
ncbi:MAG: ROK family protein [Phycisphaeraceae bacterium]|nr:ROK family protein [Phycisphaeraceae bacterium]